jgi:hypothetical protein
VHDRIERFFQQFMRKAQDRHCSQRAANVPDAFGQVGFSLSTMIEKDLMAMIYKLPRNVWPDELSTTNHQNVHAVLTRQESLEDWWRRVDSNHGPTDYETVALAT